MGARIKEKLVYGVGINDADYQVKPIVGGIQTECQFYMRWKSMLMRCYSVGFQKKYPTYVGCEISVHWRKFSNFKAWMELQDWRGKHLDKDILICGNKIYCPELCVFVDSLTNTFMADRAAARGNYPTGVSFCRLSKKPKAQCRNPFTKKQEHLGVFSSEEEAHQAWKKRKHELALQLADLQADKRVAETLRSRYL